MATAVDDAEQVTSAAAPIPCSSPYPRPPASAYDEILTLKVGKPGRNAPKVFKLYRGVLCHYSEYFKTMLNSGFQEGGSSNLDVKDTTPETFQIFYDFVYTGDLTTFTHAMVDKRTHTIFNHILAAYVFADYHLAQTFKNAILDLHLTTVVDRWALALKWTGSIYMQTAESAELRKLYVDLYSDIGELKKLEKFKDILPREFLLDLLIACRDKNLAPGAAYALSEAGGGKATWFGKTKAGFCGKYHDHTTMETRPQINIE
jgi:hypothetical protein